MRVLTISLIRGSAAHMARMTSTVRSAEPLSMNRMSKLELTFSSCAITAAAIGPALSSSLKQGMTTDSSGRGLA